MNDIFISYKVHNRKKAIEYYKLLKAQNYNVWFDQLVPKNANWKDTIQKEIKKSKLVICLLSGACLIDDWVLFQLQNARKNHCDIAFVLLDDTPWEEYEDYRVQKNIFHNLDEVPLDKYFKTKSYVREQTFGLPILTIGLYFLLSCWILLSGIHIMNLHIEHQYGYIILGILALLFFSYIHKPISYVIQSILSLGLSATSMYVIPSYFISGVAVNGILFLLFYFLAFGIRYIRMNIWLGLLKATFLAAFLTTLAGVIIILINQRFDFDITWINFIFLFGFIIFQYFCIRNDFKEKKR